MKLCAHIGPYCCYEDLLKLCYIYRIVVEPETKIKEALGWALDWHCRRERIGHNTRLDARF